MDFSKYKKYLEPILVSILVGVAANLAVKFITAFVELIVIGIVLAGVGYILYRNLDDVKAFANKYIPFYG